MSVAAVIVHFDNPRLSAVLAALHGQSMPLDQIVVVGVGPNPSETMVRAENLGFGYALKLGAETVDAEFLLLMNDDAILESNCLEILLGHLEANQHVAAVGPVLREENGGLSAGGTIIGRRWRLGHKGSVPPHPESVAWLDGAVTLVRTKAYWQIGGHTRDYFLYYEDADLSLRLRRLGWELQVVPEAQAKHVRSDRWSAMSVLRERNDLLFLERVGPRSALAAQLAWLLRSLAQRKSKGLRRARLRGLILYLRRKWGPIPSHRA